MSRFIKNSAKDIAPSSTVFSLAREYRKSKQPNEYINIKSSVSLFFPHLIFFFLLSSLYFSFIFILLFLMKRLDWTDFKAFLSCEII